MYGGAICVSGPGFNYPCVMLLSLKLDSQTMKTDLVVLPLPELTMVHYINEILHLHVIPMCRRIDFILMHNNARSHVAARYYLEVSIIKFLPNPANILDLYSNKHAWNMMGKRLRDLERPDINLSKLERTLNEMW